MPEPVRIAPNSLLGPREAEKVTQGQRPASLNTSPSGTPQPSFADMLRVQQGLATPSSAPSVPDVPGLRFSAHAQTRMSSRQITLQQEHVQRLKNAVERAEGKGARDALILMDNMAMVVSIKNRTVVTVVDRDHLKENVFTNIDSAVIA